MKEAGKERNVKREGYLKKRSQVVVGQHTCKLLGHSLFMSAVHTGELL